MPDSWCPVRYLVPRYDKTRQTCSVCRTVSTVALQVLAGVPPFDLAAMQMVVKYKLKRGYRWRNTICCMPKTS